VLDLPLDERNALLLAAGYAPGYRERELSAPDLAHVRRALTFILRQQEPYPAIVVDRGWNVVMHNDATTRVFGLFRGTALLAPEIANNALLATFHPDGLRRFVVNWEARWKVPDPTAAAAPVLSMRLERGDLSLAFFSTITTLATPQDVTLQQLRIECFHPADAVTEETARRLAATPPPPPRAAP
jgi:hypothetical protein